MKRILRGAVYAALLAAAGCVSVKPDETVLREVPRGTKLYVNRQTIGESDDNFYSPKKPHYLVKKSRQEGESDLEELVHSSKVEEAWIFHLDFESWIEIGFHEQVDSVEFRDGILMDNVVFYHIHPTYAKGGLRIFSKLTDEAYNTVLKEIAKELKKENYNMRKGVNLALLKAGLERTKLGFRSRLLLSGTLPSPRDVRVTLTYNILNCIASDRGIMEIRYLGDKPEKLRKEEAFEVKKDYDYFTKDFESMGIRHLKQTGNELETILRTVEEINSEFKGRFELKFRPWPKPIEVKR